MEGLEAELACCGCRVLCAPPIKIYQVRADEFDWSRVSVLSPHWRIFLLLFLEMPLNLIGSFFCIIELLIGQMPLSFSILVNLSPS
jgi:hypothetical protein